MTKLNEQILNKIKQAAAAENAEFQADIAAANAYAVSKKRKANGVVACSQVANKWCFRTQKVLEAAQVSYVKMGYSGSFTQYSIYSIKKETLQKIMGAHNE